MDSVFIVTLCLVVLPASYLLLPYLVLSSFGTPTWTPEGRLGAVVGAYAWIIGISFWIGILTAPGQEDYWWGWFILKVYTIPAFIGVTISLIQMIAKSMKESREAQATHAIQAVALPLIVPTPMVVSYSRWENLVRVATSWDESIDRGAVMTLTATADICERGESSIQVLEKGWWERPAENQTEENRRDRVRDELRDINVAMMRDIAAYSKIWVATRGYNAPAPTGIHQVRTVEWDMRLFSKETQLKEDIRREIPNPAVIREPIEIPAETRFEHQFILAPSGSGKTTLMMVQLLDDLAKVARGECSLIILDGKGDLIEHVPSLAMFGPGGALEGKLIYLEPDTLNPLALNFFDVGGPMSEGNERTIARRELEETILASLSDMSTAGDTMLRRLIQLCLEVEEPTIDTLIDILNPKSFASYAEYVTHLSPRAQNYFATTYIQSTRSATKDALTSRLHDAMSVDTFADMFTSKESKLNLLNTIEKPCVIVVNTNQQLLGKSGCEMFGRFFLSQLLQASLHRNSSSLPLFCYVDECHYYIARDDAIAEHLTQMRSRRIGLVFATQMIEWITSPKARQALTDAAIQFVADRQTQKQTGLFQCRIARKFDNQFIDVQVPKLPSLQHMSSAAFNALRADMRRRFATPLSERRASVEKPEAPPEPAQSRSATPPRRPTPAPSVREPTKTPKRKRPPATWDDA